MKKSLKYDAQQIAQKVLTSKSWLDRIIYITAKSLYNMYIASNLPPT